MLHATDKLVLNHPTLPLPQYLPISHKFVIKGKLRPRLNCSNSKQPNPHPSLHNPLLRLTIRGTAVIHEARDVAFTGGVDEPGGAKGHEVEVRLGVGSVGGGASGHFILVHDFTDVFHDE